MKTLSMKLNDSKVFASRHLWIVSSILLISLILRWILIFRGGQYYISDETRYEVSRDAARFLVQGQAGRALKEFTLSPEHLGFKVIGLFPALLEHVTGPSLAMPAMFFSLFSILNLYLIFLLSQRFHASSSEPLYALLLASASISLLYYARHLFPYDISMSFGLLALYIGLTRNQAIKTSLACGVLSFLCFIVYNGYWSLAGFAMLMNVILHAENISQMVRKAIVTAIGFIAPLVLLIFAMSFSGTNMVSAYRLFATTITQGSFREGGSLPFVYFWYTEHTVILILGALALFTLFNTFKGTRTPAGLWAGGIVFIYLCLLIPSVYLHYFVVYGRLARQMIPFIVLLSAEGLAQLELYAVWGRKIIMPILIILFIQAAWNFAESYRLVYPREFVAEAQTRYPKFEFSTKRLAFGAPVICQSNGYIMESAKYYVEAPEQIPHVQGQLLMSAIHPSNFLPYQYDGDPPATRQAFQTLRLQMKFYKVDDEFMSRDNPAWRTIKNCMVYENSE